MTRAEQFVGVGSRKPIPEMPEEEGYWRRANEEKVNFGGPVFPAERAYFIADRKRERLTLSRINRNFRV